MSGELHGLLDVLLERLERSGLDEDAQLLVLAAAEGDGELADALGGAAEPARRAEAAAVDEVEPPSAYLSAVTVRGFRGIGPEASLRLRPDAGLTVVLGRNGSGKSSFAEAAEVALTGTSFRWRERSSIWRTGWRNLHTDDPPAVTVELAVDGDRGRTVVTRTWAGTDDPDSSRAWVQRPGAARAPLAELGWAADLATYRPFLSYSELSGMLEDKPSVMYDALASILGLDRLADAEKRLGEARRHFEREARDVRDARGPLLEELDGLAVLDDPRAADTAAALRLRTWDLDRLAALASGEAGEGGEGGRTGDEPSREYAAMRALAQLGGPDPEGVAVAVRDLHATADAVAAVRGTDADDARRLADLLGRALQHHERHAGDATCPVCGTRDVPGHVVGAAGARRRRPAPCHRGGRRGRVWPGAAGRHGREGAADAAARRAPGGLHSGRGVAGVGLGRRPRRSAGAGRTPARRSGAAAGGGRRRTEGRRHAARRPVASLASGSAASRRARRRHERPAPQRRQGRLRMVAGGR